MVESHERNAFGLIEKVMSKQKVNKLKAGSMAPDDAARPVRRKKFGNQIPFGGSAICR